jgi:hypothetical protein
VDTACDLSAPCCDGLACVNGACAVPSCDFSGSWTGYQTTLETVESSVLGIWPSGNRIPFSGTIEAGGCTVMMDFPDDAIYRGTMDSPCHIQWSLPGQPDTVDPTNEWFKDDCNP